jgi:hypothetical protein
LARGRGDETRASALPGGVAFRSRQLLQVPFSGGGALRLEVECLEAELADLGPSWPAECRPVHAGAPDARN